MFVSYKNTEYYGADTNAQDAADSTFSFQIKNNLYFTK